MSGSHDWGGQLLWALRGSACMTFTSHVSLSVELNCKRQDEVTSQVSTRRRLSDVLKRKKPPKRSSRKGSRGEELTTDLFGAKPASSSPTGRSTPTTRAKLAGMVYPV